MNPFSRYFSWKLLVPLILGIHVILLALQGAWNSPTLDEVGHLSAGVSVWEFGRFDLYRVNPPLMKCVAAIPAVVAGAETDWSRYFDAPFGRPEWHVGTDFIAANGPNWFRWFVYARWMVIPLSLLGAYVCFRWSRELYGDQAGLLSLVLWCFCPNVLAWGATITPDLGAAALGVLASWRFWHWLKDPTWSNAFLAGLTLGLAELTKFTWVILFVLWPALWIVNRRIDQKRSHERTPDVAINARSDFTTEFAQLVMLMLLGLYVVNVGYGFSGSFQKLGDFTFGTRLLAGEESLVDGNRGGNHFRGTWAGALPMPVPREYLTGIDLQWIDFERKKSSYLNGEWKTGGWWHYYLQALAIKVPLGTWVIVMLSLGGTLFSPRFSERWRDELILLAPSLTLFVLVSSQTGFSRYLRYVLPAFPFVFIWCGKVAQTFAAKQISILVAASLVWMMMSSLWVFPHSISYFNELAGGPSGGHRYLLDANIDWGQDLFYLKKWYDEHPEARPVTIDCHSFVNLSHFGMESSRDSDPRVRWYAVSVHRLFGQDSQYEFLRQLKPIAKAGYSIWIFRVDDAPSYPLP